MAESGLVGEWKDFVFQMASMDDSTKIEQHVRDHFLKDEPLNALAGWCDTKAEEHDRLVRNLIEQGLSFVVKKKGTEEVVGVQLIMDGREDIFELHCRVSTSPNFMKMLSVLSKLGQASDDAFKTQFGSDYEAYIIMTSVSPDCRGQGLALEMYTRTLAFLKEQNFPAVRCLFSSPGAQAIGTKLEFTELGRMELKEHVDEKGETVFPNATNEFVASVAKSL